MTRTATIAAAALAAVLWMAAPAGAAHHEQMENPCNPCAAETNPCAEANPCNPCAAGGNACDAKNPCNPCNPCAAKNPCAEHGEHGDHGSHGDNPCGM